MAKYMFYQDPGHGWVKVFVKELEQLGIADKISSFSYRRKDFAYLEEDCDLDNLLYKRLTGASSPVIIHAYTLIRST